MTPDGTELMTRIARRLGLSAGVIACLAAAGCGAKVEKTAGADTSVRPVSITVDDLKRRSVARTVDVVGTLRGWDEVTVGAKKAGRVVKVFHDFGDEIKPGEKLVELETVDARLAMQQAETKYLSELARLGVTRKQAEDFLAKFGLDESLLRGEQVERRIREVPAVVQAQLAIDRAQMNLSRQKLLNGRGAGTAQDLQNAENDAATAVAAFGNAMVTARSTLASALAAKVALDVAKQTLTDMTILAPEPTAPPSSSPGGDAPSPVYAITKRAVHEGQMVKEGEALFDLVLRRPLRLWANVPERFSPEVAIGQPVRLTVASRPGEEFAGTVARINPSVDPVSRTFQVEAIVPNDRGLLRPGGFVKAAIVTRSESEAAVVPIESVVKYAGVTKIFVVEGDKARAIPVATGLEGKDWVEVTGELPAKGRVVTSGQGMLADGTPVTVRAEPNDKEREKAKVKEKEVE